MICSYNFDDFSFLNESILNSSANLLDEDNVFDSYIIQALTETENNTPLFDFYANNDGKDEPIYSEKYSESHSPILDSTAKKRSSFSGSDGEGSVCCELLRKVNYLKNKKVSSKQVKRNNKLWEFLRNLLLNKDTCPSLIKWDNYQEGMFKFVQSEKVAQLWGNRKKNNKMNYEKLSRAMRYYYRTEVLLPVPGKRLVYKFGPQATGWKTENPIL